MRAPQRRRLGGAGHLRYLTACLRQRRNAPGLDIENRLQEITGERSLAGSPDYFQGKHEMELQRIDEFRWRIPRHGKMRVDGLVFADAAMMNDIRTDQSLQQVVNVAHLPGIVGASLAMPDIHWGYGFPIGGVAAMDERRGVISPGGVGYDIN